MKRMLLIFMLLALISACKKNEDTSKSIDSVQNSSYDLTPEGLLGRIDNKSVLARLEALAAEGNEDAMVRLYFHYADTGENKKLLKISEKGSSLGYTKMMFFLAYEYKKDGGIENCNKVISLAQQIKNASADQRKIHKIIFRLGLIETNSGFKCDEDIWGF
jgi:hypothetical protein